jgi:hypothetical protein
VQQKLGHQVMFPPSNGMGLLMRGKVAGMLVFPLENVTPVPQLVSMSVQTPQFYDEVMLLLFEILPLTDDLGFGWLLSNIEKRFPSNDNRHRVSQSRVCALKTESSTSLTKVVVIPCSQLKCYERRSNLKPQG